MIVLRWGVWSGRPSWVMQFTSDGAELVTAQAHSGEIRIYNTTGWDHRTYRGGVGQTRDMAISSDEAMVAIAANDGNSTSLTSRVETCSTSSASTTGTSPTSSSSTRTGGF